MDLFRLIFHSFIHSYDWLVDWLIQSTDSLNDLMEMDATDKVWMWLFIYSQELKRSKGGPLWRLQLIISISYRQHHPVNESWIWRSPFVDPETRKSFMSDWSSSKDKTNKVAVFFRQSQKLSSESLSYYSSAEKMKSLEDLGAPRPPPPPVDVSSEYAWRNCFSFSVNFSNNMSVNKYLIKTIMTHALCDIYNHWCLCVN